MARLLMHDVGMGAPTATERLDFMVSMTNLTWPAVAAIIGNFQTLTGVGMRSIQQLNYQFDQSRSQLLAMGGVAGLTLFGVTRSALEFSRQMALVRGLMSDITDNEFKKLEESAKNIAANFGIMPSEVAQALQNVARAGVFDVAQQTKVLEAGLRLAKIEGYNAADAIAHVITSTALFGDSFENVERYANALAHAANISVTSAPKLAEALRYVGGLAQMHYTPEETLATLATMAQKGVEGSIAGISLRSFISYLMREMPKSKKALAELGLTFDDFWVKTEKGQRIRLKPLEEIILMIRQAAAVRGYGYADLPRILSQFGEPRQVQQYIKLFPTDEELVKGTWQLHQFNIEMSKTYDLESRLNKILQSAGERWNQFRVSLENLAISIGENLLPILGSLFDIGKKITTSFAQNKAATLALSTALTALAGSAALLAASWAGSAIFEGVVTSIEKIKRAATGLLGLTTTSHQVVKDLSIEKLEKRIITEERKGLSGGVTYTVPGKLVEKEGRSFIKFKETGNRFQHYIDRLLVEQFRTIYDNIDRMVPLSLNQAFADATDTLRTLRGRLDTSVDVLARASKSQADAKRSLEKYEESLNLLRDIGTLDTKALEKIDKIKDLSKRIVTQRKKIPVTPKNILSEVIKSRYTPVERILKGMPQIDTIAEENVISETLITYINKSLDRYKKILAELRKTGESKKLLNKALDEYNNLVDLVASYLATSPTIQPQLRVPEELKTYEQSLKDAQKIFRKAFKEGARTTTLREFLSVMLYGGTTSGRPGAGREEVNFLEKFIGNIEREIEKELKEPFLKGVELSPDFWETVLDQEGIKRKWKKLIEKAKKGIDFKTFTEKIEDIKKYISDSIKEQLGFHIDTEKLEEFQKSIDKLIDDVFGTTLIDLTGIHGAVRQDGKPAVPTRGERAVRELADFLETDEEKILKSFKDYRSFRKLLKNVWEKSVGEIAGEIKITSSTRPITPEELKDQIGGRRKLRDLAKLFLAKQGILPSPKMKDVNEFARKIVGLEEFEKITRKEIIPEGIPLGDELLKIYGTWVNRIREKGLKAPHLYKNEYQKMQKAATKLYNAVYEQRKIYLEDLTKFGEPSRDDVIKLRNKLLNELEQITKEKTVIALRKAQTEKTMTTYQARLDRYQMIEKEGGILTERQAKEMEQISDAIRGYTSVIDTYDRMLNNLEKQSNIISENIVQLENAIEKDRRFRVGPLGRLKDFFYKYGTVGEVYDKSSISRAVNTAQKILKTPMKSLNNLFEGIKGFLSEINKVLFDPTLSLKQQIKKIEEIRIYSENIPKISSSIFRLTSDLIRRPLGKLMIKFPSLVPFFSVILADSKEIYNDIKEYHQRRKELEEEKERVRQRIFGLREDLINLQAEAARATAEVRIGRTPAENRAIQRALSLMKGRKEALIERAKDLKQLYEKGEEFNAREVVDFEEIIKTYNKLKQLPEEKKTIGLRNTIKRFEDVIEKFPEVKAAIEEGRKVQDTEQVKRFFQEFNRTPDLFTDMMLEDIEEQKKEWDLLIEDYNKNKEKVSNRTREEMRRILKKAGVGEGKFIEYSVKRRRAEQARQKVAEVERELERSKREYEEISQELKSDQKVKDLLSKIVSSYSMGGELFDKIKQFRPSQTKFFQDVIKKTWIETSQLWTEQKMPVTFTIDLERKIDQAYKKFIANITKFIEKIKQTITEGTKTLVSKILGSAEFESFEARGIGQIVARGRRIIKNTLSSLLEGLGEVKRGYLTAFFGEKTGEVINRFTGLAFLKNLATYSKDLTFQFLRGIPVIGNFIKRMEESNNKLGTLIEIFRGLPAFGVLTAVISVLLGAITLWTAKWSQDMEIVTKKIQSYQKSIEGLEKQEDILIQKREAAKTEEEKRGYGKELEKIRAELEVRYERLAALNMQKFRLQAAHPAYWPIFRGTPGPEWYGGGPLEKILYWFSPSKWASGYNIARIMGFGPRTNQWLTPEREQMLAEAYQVAEQRKARLKEFEETYLARYQTLETQRKTGRITAAEYAKQRNLLFEQYRVEREKIERTFDRKLAPIVGPKNVEAVKKLYETEEKLKEEQILLTNAIGKLIQAIFMLIQTLMLPLRLFGLGPDVYSPQGDIEEYPYASQDISTSIDAMTISMEQTIKEIQQTREAIKQSADGILYTLYRINYGIDFIGGLIAFITTPQKWFDLSSFPNPFPESYETWQAKNVLGIPHRRPYYPEGSPEKIEEEIRKKHKGKEISAATGRPYYKMSDEEIRARFEQLQKEKKEAEIKREERLQKLAEGEKLPEKTPEAQKYEEILQKYNIPITTPGITKTGEAVAQPQPIELPLTAPGTVPQVEPSPTLMGLPQQVAGVGESITGLPLTKVANLLGGIGGQTQVPQTFGEIPETGYMPEEEVEETQPTQPRTPGAGGYTVVIPYTAAPSFFEKVRDAFVNVVKEIQNIFKNVGNTIQGFFDSIFGRKEEEEPKPEIKSHTIRNILPWILGALGVEYILRHTEAGPSSLIDVIKTLPGLLKHGINRYIDEDMTKLQAAREIYRWSRDTIVKENLRPIVQELMQKVLQIDKISEIFEKIRFFFTSRELATARTLKRLAPRTFPAGSLDAVLGISEMRQRIDQLGGFPKILGIHLMEEDFRRLKDELFKAINLANLRKAAEKMGKILGLGELADDISSGIKKVLKLGIEKLPVDNEIFSSLQKFLIEQFALDRLQQFIEEGRIIPKISDKIQERLTEELIKLGVDLSRVPKEEKNIYGLLRRFIIANFIDPLKTEKSWREILFGRYPRTAALSEGVKTGAGLEREIEKGIFWKFVEGDYKIRETLQKQLAGGYRKAIEFLLKDILPEPGEIPKEMRGRGGIHAPGGRQILSEEAVRSLTTYKEFREEILKMGKIFKDFIQQLSIVEKIQAKISGTIWEKAATKIGRFSEGFFSRFIQVLASQNGSIYRAVKEGIIAGMAQAQFSELVKQMGGWVKDTGIVDKISLALAGMPGGKILAKIGSPILGGMGRLGELIGGWGLAKGGTLGGIAGRIGGILAKVARIDPRIAGAVAIIGAIAGALFLWKRQTKTAEEQLEETKKQTQMMEEAKYTKIIPAPGWVKKQAEQPWQPYGKYQKEYKPVTIETEEGNRYTIYEKRSPWSKALTALGIGGAGIGALAYFSPAFRQQLLQGIATGSKVGAGVITKVLQWLKQFLRFLPKISFKSPLKIRKGFTGALQSGSIVFPQLDPDLFRQKALETSQAISSVFLSAIPFLKKDPERHLKDVSEKISDVKTLLKQKLGKDFGTLPLGAAAVAGLATGVDARTGKQSKIGTILDIINAYTLFRSIPLFFRFGGKIPVIGPYIEKAGTFLFETAQKVLPNQIFDPLYKIMTKGISRPLLRKLLQILPGGGRIGSILGKLSIENITKILSSLFTKGSLTSLAGRITPLLGRILGGAGGIVGRALPLLGSALPAIAGVLGGMGPLGWGLLAALAVGGGLFFLLRRKKKPKPEETSVSPEGTEVPSEEVGAKSEGGFVPLQRTRGRGLGKYLPLLGLGLGIPLLPLIFGRTGGMGATKGRENLFTRIIELFTGERPIRDRIFSEILKKDPPIPFLPSIFGKIVRIVLGRGLGIGGMGLLLLPFLGRITRVLMEIPRDIFRHFREPLSFLRKSPFSTFISPLFLGVISIANMIRRVLGKGFPQGDIFGSLHSPFKITRGFEGKIGGKVTQIEFPQLDPDLFQQKAVEAGKKTAQEIGKQAPQIIIQEGGIVINTEDPEKMKEKVIEALVESARQINLTSGGI